MTDALDSFFARCAARGLTAGTREFYRLHLNGFVRYLGERHPEAGPRQVTPAIVREFLGYERTRCSAANAKHARRVLSVFFGHLAREGMIAENPIAKVEQVKAGEKLVRPLSEDEVERLLATANAKTFLGSRLRALVMVMVDCGLRASEACGLDLADVNLNAGLVRVRHAKGNKEREVPFGEAARAALLTYLGKRGELAQQAVFVTHYGERLDRHGLLRLLSRAGAKAGVANVHPHRLRHSAATFFLRGGGSIFALQRMLGHSSLTMVRRYAEVTQSDLVEQHRQASPGDRFMAAVVKGGGRKRLR